MAKATKKRKVIVESTVKLICYLNNIISLTNKKGEVFLDLQLENGF
jgi:hypothetical protein